MEFLELTFGRHVTCNLLCDTSLVLARSSPTRRYTGHYSFFVGEYLNDLGLLVFSSASHQDGFDMI